MWRQEQEKHQSGIDNAKLQIKSVREKIQQARDRNNSSAGAVERELLNLDTIRLVCSRRA